LFATSRAAAACPAAAPCAVRCCCLLLAYEYIPYRTKGYKHQPMMDQILNRGKQLPLERREIEEMPVVKMEPNFEVVPMEDRENDFSCRTASAADRTKLPR